MRENMATEKENISEWLEALDNASKSSRYQALFKKVRRLLLVPSRGRGSVSTRKINMHTNEGDNVIVPKKVLYDGAIDHKISIAALEYSSGARSQLRSSGCSIVSIKEMTEKNRINVII